MKPSGTKLVLIVTAIALAVAGVGTFSYVLMRPSASRPDTEAGVTNPNQLSGGIGALGRLEPEGKVFKIAAPAVGFSSRVAKIMVKEGDRVKVGQPVAVMDNFESLRASGLQAEAQVREAQARLAQVKAGAKQGDINAQRTSVMQSQTALRQAIAELEQSDAARLKAEAELQKLQWDLGRYQQLFQEGAIAEAELKSRRLAFDAQTKQVIQARKLVEQRQQGVEAARLAIAQEAQQLNSVAEVRPTDVRQAQEQVRVAMANLQKAKADFDNSIVRSPVDGQVLTIHTKENESVSSDGIMELGQTSQMYAVAEVDENLIARVRLGQRALIRSEAFPGELTGVVRQISQKVGKNNITSTDPADKQDTRVVEVRIQLDDSTLVAGLTNLQVKVSIQP
jgi:HlyD family secretion protein